MIKWDTARKSLTIVPGLSSWAVMMPWCGIDHDDDHSDGDVRRWVAEFCVPWRTQRCPTRAHGWVGQIHLIYKLLIVKCDTASNTFYGKMKEGCKFWETFDKASGRGWNFCCILKSRCEKEKKDFLQTEFDPRLGAGAPDSFWPQPGTHRFVQFCWPGRILSTATGSSILMASIHFLENPPRLQKLSSPTEKSEVEAKAE